MGIMPHKDIDRALELALSLDIPFWPQLPNVSFHEDMYAQTSQNLPGIAIDVEGERVLFDTAKFADELPVYSERMADPATFALTEEYSAVYHRFLSENLAGRYAIRGQLTGPVSFGFKIVDESGKPIIYNDEVRSILFDFVQRKANAQYRDLRERNSNAFVWVDEPGLGWVFSSMSGYNETQAKSDYAEFLSGIEGPKALHLCANVNLPYLLELGIDILSFDAYQLSTMPREYAGAVARHLQNGGIVCWGIVPTDSTNQENESPESLARLLDGYWNAIFRSTQLSPDQVARQSLLAPARCCLKNIGQVGAAGEAACPMDQKGYTGSIEETLVERAFVWLQEMSEIMVRTYQLQAVR